MNPEQKKVRKFFENFTGNTVNKTLSWLGVGLSVGTLVLGSFLPAQMMLEDLRESVALVLLIVVCGPLAGSLRIMPYQSYGTSPNNRKVSDILKYHPIDRNEIKKMELFYLIRFMAKVAVVCMIVQIPVTIYEYGRLAWINFAYIFFVAFVYPVAINILSICFEK